MAGRSECREQLRDRQSGVSLVEIVVAMFLLALMSVAVLPLMIGTVRASATNSELLAADSLANAQLATLQASFPNATANSCAAVSATATSGVADPSGSGATASITFGACPASYPATVKVTVQAYRPDSTKAVITLDSEILVSSA